jgi:hypothetical protein
MKVLEVSLASPGTKRFQILHIAQTSGTSMLEETGTMSAVYYVTKKVIAEKNIVLGNARHIRRNQKSDIR